MNNGRDCAHGRQVGKCDTCDLIDAEQRILELEAQVEHLRVAATVVLNTRDEDGITTSGLLAKFDELSKALSFLPAQCLAEIKAQAVIDAIDTHKNRFLTFGFDTAIRVNDLIRYANQLRQQDKRGDL